MHLLLAEEDTNIIVMCPESFFIGFDRFLGGRVSSAPGVDKLEFRYILG